MKTLHPALQAHLDDGTTTLAWCWRIARADGTSFGFTDHDRTLSFDGTDFEPESGLTASEVRSGSDLSVDAQDAEGVLTSGRITETDILDGRWDNADVEVWRVNWADTGQRVLMRRGAIGQIRRGRLAFVAEVRSLAHVLGQTVGRTFQATCDAALGDPRCGVDLEGPAYKGTGAVIDLLRDRAFTASGLGGFEDGWFTFGTLDWTSGANAGRRTEVLDLPQLTEDQPAHRPLVAAHAMPWPGEMAVFRSPSTDGFELLTTFGSRVRIGTLVSDFYAGPTSRFDLGNALVVDLLSGTLEGVTDLTLFGGANALAIESAPGVWEIVQAGAAELLAPGRYRLTRLLRGQRGTEGAMGNPAPAGARVVVLDAALASLPIAEADLGIPWNWRIGPASRPVSDETYVAQAFTPEGIGLRPFSVAHIEQPWRTPSTPGDLTIRWTRRSRALSADSWGGLEVPLGEELEAYDVEILDGATVKRVLSTATTSAVYTAVQQSADWGAPLGPGDTLDIRIYQLSALVGRGAPKTVTLIL